MRIALRPKPLLCLAAITFVLPYAPLAEAQEFEQYLNPVVPGFGEQPGVTVTSRLRPEYDYPGLHLGGFTIHSELQESTGYDSNVTGTTPAHGSSFLETNGNAQASSNWNRNSLAGAITFDNYQYFDQPRQSYTNWTASLGGTYDIGSDVLYLGYAHLNLNQTSRDLDVPQLQNPTPYRIDDVRTSYKANFDPLTVQPGIEVANYDFSNGIVAGQPFIQTFRNRVVLTPSVQASYEFSSLRKIVVVVRDSIADFTTPVAGIARQNFNDLSVLGGVVYDTGGPLQFRALVGYQIRTFTSSQYKTISAPIAELSATWTPTGLTTVTGSVARYIEESASDTTAAFTETALKLSVDHEYLRNVLLNANGALYKDSYQQGGDQSYYAAGGGVTWLMNRHMRLEARYTFASRQSPANSSANAGLGNGVIFGGSYNESLFLVQLRLGL